MRTLIRTGVIVVLTLVTVNAAGQPSPGILPLSSSRVPAEVRSLSNGQALVLYRDAFRGYTPAAASAIELRDTDGTLIWERRPGVDIPDATIMTLLDATVTTRGQVVVSLVAARPGAGTAHLLGYYSTGSDQNIRMVVIPAACFRLTAAIDEGVWCLGPHVERHNQGNLDFQFLHHFSEDGRLSRSIGERKSFPGSPRPWDGRSQLVATPENVVVWMANKSDLVTFDNAGRLLSVVNVPSAPVVSDQPADVILTTDGNLFSLGITQQPTDQLASWRRSLFAFNRETSTWSATTINGLSMAIRLVGSGHGMVTLWDRDRPRLLRVKP